MGQLIQDDDHPPGVLGEDRGQALGGRVDGLDPAETGRRDNPAGLRRTRRGGHGALDLVDVEQFPLNPPDRFLREFDPRGLGPAGRGHGHKPAVTEFDPRILDADRDRPADHTRGDGQAGNRGEVRRTGNRPADLDGQLGQAQGEHVERELPGGGNPVQDRGVPGRDQGVNLAGPAAEPCG